MRRKRTTEIVVETEELLVITRPSGPTFGWCDGCRREVAMVPPEAAAALTGTTARAIYRLAEAGLVHFAETPGGLLLVCPCLLPPQTGAVD